MIKQIARKAVLIYPEFDTSGYLLELYHKPKMYTQASEFGLPKRLLPPLSLLGLFNQLRQLAINNPPKLLVFLFVFGVATPVT